MNENRTNQDDLFSKRLRAGRRRTYFFDVRATRSNDYYLTITESKKKFNEDGYERHKIFLYKEDFNKFLAGLKETIDHIKTDLLPEYDFDEFSHKDDDYQPRHRSTSQSRQSDQGTPGDQDSQLVEEEHSGPTVIPVEGSDDGMDNPGESDSGSDFTATADEDTVEDAASPDAPAATTEAAEPAEAENRDNDTHASGGDEEALKWD